MKYSYCIPAALALLLLVGGPGMAEETQQEAAAASQSLADLEGKSITGKVLETMDSGGYTYFKVDTPQGQPWVAIPQSTVEVGQEIHARPGMVMANFQSKTLNRTFDAIIFSAGLTEAGKKFNREGGNGAMGSGTGGGGSSFSDALQAEQGGSSPHGAMGGAMGGAAGMAAESGGSTTAVVPAAEVKVDKATGDNGYTIEECYAQAADLNNQNVQVRGKVMKVSRMIMGKNWLHLQDGTGNPMQNTHDLVVTTLAEPEMDSVVQIEGVLHANKDFGAGYQYDVIVEDAEIK